MLSHRNLRRPAASLLTLGLVALAPTAALGLQTDLPAATAPGEDATPDGSVDLAIHRNLREQREAGHRVDPALLEALAPLAEQAPQSLVDVILANAVPPVEADQTSQTLNRYQLQLALDALSAVAEPAVVLPRPAELADSDLGIQVAALRLVGILAPEDDPSQVLRVASACLPPTDPDADPQLPTPVDRELTEALRRSLADTLGRGAGQFDSIARPLANLDPRLVPAALAGVGDDGDPRALPLLRNELRRRRDSAPSVLAAITRCAPSLDPQVDAAVARSIAPLIDPVDRHTCVAALRALGALRTDVALDELVDLLDRDDEVGTQAHRALSEITAAQLPHHPRLWREWIDSERHFTARRLPKVVRGLGELATSELAPRLRELSGRPLARHSVAQELAILLDHRDPAARAAACSAIAGTGSPTSLVFLAEALFDEDDVATAALDALQALTPDVDGRPVEPDGHAWLTWIADQTPRH